MNDQMKSKCSCPPSAAAQEDKRAFINFRRTSVHLLTSGGHVNFYFYQENKRAFINFRRTSLHLLTSGGQVNFYFYQDNKRTNIISQLSGNKMLLSPFGCRSGGQECIY
jgi:hypothetical protein